MVTLQDALEELGYDEYDDVIERKVTRALSAAHAKLRGAVGDDVENVLYNDPRVDALVLIYTRENYDAGNLSEKEIRALKHLRDDLEPQLRRELSRAKAEAAAGGDTV